MIGADVGYYVRGGEGANI